MSLYQRDKPRACGRRLYFSLDRIAERESGWRFAGRSLDRKSFSYERTILRCSCFEIAAARRVAGVDCGERER